MSKQDKMSITITIPLDLSEFTNADMDLIRSSLSVDSSEKDEDVLLKIGKTAFMEYLKMFKESGIPKRAEEVQQERLYFFLTHYFKDRFPEESVISSIFQLTASQSKTLIRNTKSRYRTKISRIINNSLRKELEKGDKPRKGDIYEFDCPSSTTIEELNLFISQRSKGKVPIKKHETIASRYKCDYDTYDFLIKNLPR